MLERVAVIRTGNTSPYRNIAVEKYLMDHVPPGLCVLYLWRNANTVVIGRNQSARAEVRLDALEKAGGHLARRLSGGGAVYHDLGNLNFTFVVRHADYDVARQTDVVLRAVRALGVDAERTGRNDLLASGRKFSGHAYYRSGDACYHHGTLMVDVDADALGRFLRPSSDKLASKGVRSVHSRVVNLADLRPGLTVGMLAESLVEAFGEAYGMAVEELDESVLDEDETAASTERFSSREWLLRDELEEGSQAHGRFPWGEASVRYVLDGGTIRDCTLSSDGLEADYLASVPALLRGCAFEREAVEAALLSGATDGELEGIARDVAGLMFPAGEASASR